jgi:hypothetical protein
MKLGKSSLFRKMLYTPRLNMTCDGVKLRLAYVKNDVGSGWFIENFNNDGKENWFKEKMTKEIVDMIFEKYKEVNVTWSRTI